MGQEAQVVPKIRVLSSAILVMANKIMAQCQDQTVIIEIPQMVPDQELQVEYPT